MYRYAQILNNKVHWLFTHEMSLQELYLNKFSQEIVLVDITNQALNIAEGWLYIDGQFINPEPVVTIEQLRVVKKSDIYQNDFVPARDKIVWLDDYGYDCEEKDRVNWNNAITLLKESNNDTIDYWVWTKDEAVTESKKALKKHTLDQLVKVGEAVALQQNKALEKLYSLQLKIDQATDLKDLEDIKW